MFNYLLNNFLLNLNNYPLIRQTKTKVVKIEYARKRETFLDKIQLNIKEIFEKFDQLLRPCTYGAVLDNAASTASAERPQPCCVSGLDITFHCHAAVV